MVDLNSIRAIITLNITSKPVPSNRILSNMVATTLALCDYLKNLASESEEKNFQPDTAFMNFNLNFKNQIWLPH